MFSFIDHVYEIWTVAEKRDVDVGVGYSMFATDVRLGKAIDTNTADALPNFDFAAASKEWNSMTKEEQSQAYHNYHEFEQKMYFDICDAYKKGRAAVDELVNAYKNGECDGNNE